MIIPKELLNYVFSSIDSDKPGEGLYNTKANIDRELQDKGYDDFLIYIKKLESFIDCKKSISKKYNTHINTKTYTYKHLMTEIVYVINTYRNDVDECLNELVKIHNDNLAYEEMHASDRTIVETKVKNRAVKSKKPKTSKQTDNILDKESLLAKFGNILSFK